MVVTYFISELSEHGRKHEDSNKNAKYNILSCQQELALWSHYSEQDENMKNMTAVFQAFFFFLKWEYYPKIFKWLGIKSNSQILMYCLIFLFGDKIRT